jgi:hypothetical protein
MAGTQSQVIGGHDMILYMQNWSTGVSAPGSGTAWGVAWGGGWVDRGYTRDGLRFTHNVTRNQIQIDQLVDPVLRIATNRDLRMGSRMAQITASNVFSATGQGVTTTATPPPDTAGNDRLDFTGNLLDQYIACGFDIRNPGDTQAVRVVGYHGLPQGDAAINFTYTDAATISFEIALVPDSTVLVGGFPRIASFLDTYAPTGGA